MGNELSPFTWSSISFISFCIVSRFIESLWVKLLACGGGGAWNLLKFVVPCSLFWNLKEFPERVSVFVRRVFYLFSFFLFVIICTERSSSFDLINYFINYWIKKYMIIFLKNCLHNSWNIFWRHLDIILKR